MATQTINVSGTEVAASAVHGGRLAGYVMELREFFAVRGMKFGAPGDLEEFAAALRQPGTFAEELGSITRSVIYREQGTVAIPELLELMTVAMGGEQIAQAAEQVRGPVRDLLAFVSKTTRNGRGPALVESATTVAGPSENEVPAVLMEDTRGAAEVEAIELVMPEADAAKIEAEKTDSTALPAAVLHQHQATEFYARARSLSPKMEGDDAVALDGPEFDRVDAAVADGSLSERRGERVFTVKLSSNDGSSDQEYDKPKTGPVQWRRALAICAVTGLVVVAVMSLRPWLWSSVGTREDAEIAAMGPSEAGNDAGGERTGSTTAPNFGTGSGTVSVSPQIGAKMGTVRGARGVDGRLNRDLSSAGVTVSGAGDVGAADSREREEAGRFDTYPPNTDGANSNVAGAFTDSNTVETISSGTMNADRYSLPARISPPTRAMPGRRAGVYTVSSGVMAGNLISAPTPDYPKLAGLFHMEGQVILQAVVSRNGRVVATHVLRGHRLLRGAAEDAVRRWRYRPFYVNGQSTDVATIVTVNFRRR